MDCDEGDGLGMVVSTTAFSAFERRFPTIGILSLSLLGLVAVRVWIQCVIYGFYQMTDSGEVTVATNLIRVAFIIPLLAVAMSRRPNAKTRRLLSGVSVLAMTLAPVLELLGMSGETILPQNATFWLVCSLGGFGVAWGGGMWMLAFERLNPHESFLYTFASVALSALAGLILGFVPVEGGMLLAVFMPAASFIAFERSLRALKDRPAQETKGEDRSGDVGFKRSLAKALAGVVLFNFALGVARGFPYGQSLELSVPFQALHQLCSVFLCALFVAWVFLLNKRLASQEMWGVAMLFIAGGVFLLSFSEPGVESAGAALVAVANTFCLALLWYLSYDVARHLRVGAHVVLGVVWTAHLLPREIGRGFMLQFGPSVDSPLLLATGVVCCLALGFWLLARDSQDGAALLFSGLNEMTSAVASKVGERGPGLSVSGDPESAIALQSDPFAVLARDFALTPREVDVARLLAAGRSKSAIADKLFLSENTVRTHSRNLYAKLSIHSRQELLDVLEEISSR